MSRTDVEVSGAKGAEPTHGPWAPDSLLENLQLIADGVVAVAGFAVAAIRVRRGDELELVVDTGLPESRGNRIPVQLMLDELDRAEDWGLLQFVPHGDDDSASLGWVVPDVVISDDPDAWHPMDMLVAPLYDARGVLRGTLAIDEPLDGRLPEPERRRVLERFAVLAGRAVLASVEREALAEQVAMADTVKTIVRTTSAQLSSRACSRQVSRPCSTASRPSDSGSRPSRTTTGPRSTCRMTSPSPYRPTSWPSPSARRPTAGGSRS